MTTAIDSQAEDERRRLEECVREPIRTPGTIQPHGALITVDVATLVVMHASENCGAIVGAEATALLGGQLSALVGDQWLAENLESITGAVAVRNPIPLRLGARRFETIVHSGQPLVVIEFEPTLADEDDRSAVAVYSAIHRLARISTRDELWTAAAQELCKLTEFERVTIYSFHPDGHGEIVAEEVPDDMQPYLGLHFPASDIPEQARQLYLTKLSRQIVDNSGETSTLLALDTDGPAVSFDLSAAELRSVSPHHLQFMRNMGQASTLSLSLVTDGRLIGMITLASRTPHRVSYLHRQGLEVLATHVTLQLASMDEIDRLTADVQARAIRSQLVGQSRVRESTDSAGLAAALFDGDPTVLDLIAAQGAVLCLGDATFTVGEVPPPEAIAGLTAWKRSRTEGGTFVSQALPAQNPTLAALLPGVTGLLLVPLPAAGDYIAWFRPEITEDVSWLGAQTADNRVTTLSPRTSFSAWTQSVSGKSEPWGDLPAAAEELSRDLAGVMVRHAEAKLAALALRDSLTGLPNRRLLIERLDHALARDHSLPTALLFIDVDAFKSVNDTHGHDVGDLVLVTTARRILDSTRSGDTVARIGGDEFVVLCENTTTDEAEAVARRIVAAVEQPLDASGTTLVVTASVGVAMADATSISGDLLRGADGAMYRAKKAGRGRTSR